MRVGFLVCSSMSYLGWIRVTVIVEASRITRVSCLGDLWLPPNPLAAALQRMGLQAGRRQGAEAGPAHPQLLDQNYIQCGHSQPEELPNLVPACGGGAQSGAHSQGYDQSALVVPTGKGTIRMRCCRQPRVRSGCAGAHRQGYAQDALVLTAKGTIRMRWCPQARV